MTETDKQKEDSLSALDPGKQGLKQTALGEIEADSRLSALDPGKQGLKPDREVCNCVMATSFSA